MPAEDSNLADSRFAATFVSHHQDFSKEQQDLALAALLLRSGSLTERQLSTALSNWTIHGNVPLAEHLASLKLLGEPKLQQLCEQVLQQLDECRDEVKKSNGSASKSVLLGTLDAIDPSGTVARLMGISCGRRNGGQ